MPTTIEHEARNIMKHLLFAAVAAIAVQGYASVRAGEIITEPGVEVVGPLPRDNSTPTALVGFVSTQAKEPEAAKALLAYFSGREAAKVYKERGMEPGR
jgi:molybdate transport system substrate-binding protein